MTSASFIGSQKRRQRLLNFLADGKFHSGEALARRLRISRSAIWKLVGALREQGVTLSAVPQKLFWGYGAELQDPDGYVVRLWGTA